jgi:hypothetical protein
LITEPEPLQEQALPQGPELLQERGPLREQVLPQAQEPLQEPERFLLPELADPG